MLHYRVAIPNRTKRQQHTWITPQRSTQQHQEMEVPAIGTFQYCLVPTPATLWQMCYTPTLSFDASCASKGNRGRRRPVREHSSTTWLCDEIAVGCSGAAVQCSETVVHCSETAVHCSEAAVCSETAATLDCSARSIHVSHKLSVTSLVPGTTSRELNIPCKPTLQTDRPSAAGMHPTPPPQTPPHRQVPHIQPLTAAE